MSGGFADPAALNAAALAELTDIGLEMMRLVRSSARAAGDLTPERAAVLETVARMVRRTVALNARLFADSRKTPEQLAAEAARREASAEWARLQAATALVRHKVIEEIDPATKPSDRENLLSELRERLLHPNIQEALTRMEVSAMVLRLCQDIGITPRKETWSDALMAREAAEARAALARDADARAKWQAGVAAGGDWRAGVEFSPPPGEIRKIGRFTCGPSGAVIAEEPMETDRPQSEWAPDVLGRALPDFSRKNKPPDSG